MMFQIYVHLVSDVVYIYDQINFYNLKLNQVTIYEMESDYIHQILQLFYVHIFFLIYTVLEKRADFMDSNEINEEYKFPNTQRCGYRKAQLCNYKSTKKDYNNKE